MKGTQIQRQSLLSGVYNLEGKLSLIYWNEKKKKIYKKQLLPFLNTKDSLHSTHVMNLTALNGFEALIIRELVVIRISLLNQSAS